MKDIADFFVPLVKNHSTCTLWTLEPALLKRGYCTNLFATPNVATLPKLGSYQTVVDTSVLISTLKESIRNHLQVTFTKW